MLCICRHFPASPAVVLSALIAAGPASAMTARHQPHVTPATAVRTLAARVFSLVNRDRAAAHVAPLILDRVLTRVATAYSKNMGLHHYFDHVGPDGVDPAGRITRAGIRFTMAAENIGFSSGLAPVQGVVTINADMMSEPLVEGSHHANLVDARLHRVGVGTYLAPNNTVYLTEDFTN